MHYLAESEVKQEEALREYRNRNASVTESIVKISKRLNITKMASYRRLKVLVVDDSITVQKIMLKLLRQENCMVTTADNGDQGLRLMKLEQFDICFMDFLMVSTSTYIHR